MILRKNCIRWLRIWREQNSGNLTVYDKGEFENEVQRYVAETAQENVDKSN